MFQICACSAGVLRCPSAAMRTVHRVSVGRPFVQSLEDLEQVSGWKVSDIQLVHVPDPREDVHKLQIFDADEVMQTRQIGDEVPSRFEAEDLERMKSSAMFSSLSIPAVDANSTCLPLKGRLRRTGPVVRLLPR